MVAYTASLFRIAGHTRCGLLQIVHRTVAAVGVRPGPSSFAQIFGASPQYCMLGAPSILRSWVESRDVQISTRPVDLVGEIEFSEAGSTRLARPEWHSPHGPSPTWGPSFRSAARRGPPLYSSPLGTAKLPISDCRGLLLVTCPLLRGRLLTRGLRRHFLGHATFS